MTDDTEYTLAHVARLDLLIRREVLRLRVERAQHADDAFRGLYISEADVDALLDRSLAASAILAPAPPADAADPTGPPNHQPATLSAAMSAVSAQILALERAAGERGDLPPLSRLGQFFGLSEFERQVLVVALAAELDLKYERLYAYLQDDVTKKRPTVDLVMRLLCPSLDARLAMRRVFEPGAPLLRWELVTLHDDPGARQPVLLARALKLDERVAGYLLGSDAIDGRLESLAVAPPASRADVLPPDVRRRLSGWCSRWQATWDWNAGGAEHTPVVLFHGRYGTGKRAAAAFLAGALGRPLLLLDAAGLGSSPSGLEQGLRLAEREALLAGALLCWHQADGYLRPGPGDAAREAEQRTFLRALAQGQVPTILLVEDAWEPGRRLAGRPFLRQELPDATYAARRALWAAGLNGAVAVDTTTSGLDEQQVSALAGRFRLTPGQIADALERARSLAWARDPLHGRVTVEDVDAASRAQAQHHLGALARKLTPRYTWRDIVLPGAQLTTLRLICTMIRQRAVVYGEWGFDQKLAMGKGVLALFAGPSGTGKTMAAEILARELGLDVYKIDLSAVVNKYIGETEKNLEKLFTEAQDSDAILFFDEADALFGKRSGVSDAHDRYANIETAYLLQRTEEYNGLVILASNLPKNMDEAFVRRLHFTVTFPVPEEAERLEIWRRTFPAEAPQAADLDLPFLARQLKITGGNIRNIILAAAFLAAEEGGPIAMRHLVLAARYEFQKMGKMVLERDFERYFELIRT
jgi:AAA+ superfamily predicted ATPase